MRNRAAFTLIELLVATALTGLLMVAVLGVTASLGEPRRVIGTSKATFAWEAAALELLEQDLLLARRVELKEDELIIEGQMELHAVTLTQRHRPVRVVYRLVGDTGMLEREQRSLLDARGQERSRHFVLAGVRDVRFVLTPAPDDGPLEPEQGGGAGGAGVSGGAGGAGAAGGASEGGTAEEMPDRPPLPAAVRVDVEMTDETALRRTIRLR